jgi:hypothetical protein
MIDENNRIRLEKVLPNVRRGTYYIVQAKLECSYDSVLSVVKRMKYWNEDIYKMVKKINTLSDEDFAVELVRAKKKNKETLRLKNILSQSEK